jgi:hypothetical protein
MADIRREGRQAPQGLILTGDQGNLERLAAPPPEVWIHPL